MGSGVSVEATAADQAEIQKHTVFVISSLTDPQKQPSEQSFRPPFSKGGEVQGEEPCRGEPANTYI